MAVEVLSMLVLVINLDASVDRMRNMSEQLKRMDVSFSRISAVDGGKLSEKFVDSIVPPFSDVLARLDFPKKLTKGEIGCFLSHRKCWQTLLESKEEWALVLEDDVYISDRVKEYIGREDWIPEGAGFVQLNIDRKRSFCIRPRSVELDTGDTLYRIFYPYPMGAFAYIISRRTAEDALISSAKIVAPVDEFLFAFRSKFSRRHIIYTLNPAVVTVQEIPSIIGNRGEKRKKLLLARFHPKVLLFKLYVFILRCFFRKRVEIYFEN